MNLNFFEGKKVFITGHTGFKGSWLCEMLWKAGAKVTGYALEPPTDSNLFRLCNLDHKIESVIGDIRDLSHLKETFIRVQPEIVIHMAAQPIVRESYRNPVYTYETNVMGTVNILECLRETESVKSFLNVTTDKVYLNKEWCWGYRENEELNGYDPYSNSKSCSELVTASYRNSFFQDRDVAISTARAGNVIGGGDFAADRIIPDCIRAIIKKEPILVRNPYSVRPYQHVLEPLNVYLTILEKQYKDKKLQGSYNVGPDEKGCLTTGRVVDMFCQKWNAQSERKITWIDQSDGGPHEAQFLKLDCSKIKSTFGWNPHWNMEKAVDSIIEWTKVFIGNGDIEACIERQIEDFLRE